MKLYHYFFILLIVAIVVLPGCEEHEQTLNPPSIIHHSASMKVHPDTLTNAAPSTLIQYTLPEDAVVSLTVSTPGGPLVAVIMDNQTLPSGTYSEQFSMEKLSSGVYYLYLVYFSEGGVRYESMHRIVIMK